MQSGETAIHLSGEETVEKLNKIFEDTTNLMTGHSEAISYWTDNDFTTIEDIQDYEAIWKKLADDAKSIEDDFTKYIPEQKYEDSWESYQSNISEIRELLSTCVKLDANGDGTYTGDEITGLIKSCGTELVNRYQAIVSIVDTSVIIDSKDVSTQNMAICNIANCDNEATSAIRTTRSDVLVFSCEEHLSLHCQMMELTSPGQWSKVPISSCAECTSIATRIVKNPFSGQEEFYCAKHYDEIISMIEYMQNDVSNSSDTEINSARHTNSESWACTQKIVKDNLKTPSSAKFCSMSEATITHNGNGQYSVSGWVEAQNSYGAVVRQSFIVNYTATASGFTNASVSFN